MKAIILEDESVAVRRLERLLTQQDKHPIDVIATFDNVADTAEYLICNEPPDILFLDIHVADGNSFELFNIVDIRSDVIFTTAYNEYATQAFRKNALDYLLKPIKLTELEEAIGRKNKLTKKKKEEIKALYSDYKNRFLIRFGAKLHIVKTEDLAYIYSENKISYFVLHTGKRIPSDYKLQELEQMLDPKLFFRLNRQVVVYIDAIDEIISYSKSRLKVRLTPPYHNEIVVSTDTTPRFKNWLDR